MYDRTRRGHKKGRTLPDEHEPEALDAPTLTAKRDMLAKDLREASERLQKEREARQSAAGAAEPAGATGPADDGDSLEAFMRGVDARLESDELFVLERRAQELERELEATKKLLHLADPDGYDCVCGLPCVSCSWLGGGDGKFVCCLGNTCRVVLPARRLFSSGSKAAREAVQRATEKLEGRRRAQEKERVQKRAVESIGSAVPALEPTPEPKSEGASAFEVDTRAPSSAPSSPPPPAAVHRLEQAAEQAGLEIRKRPAAAQAPASAPAPAKAPPSSYEARCAHIAAELAKHAKPARQAPAQPAIATPEARVAADLELLLAGRRRPVDESEAPEGDTWAPPQGQRGDGRSHLNQTYGY